MRHRSYQHTAYLIVICDKLTNEILEVATWSSPEWEQSRRLENPTYVAYATYGNSYQDALDNLFEIIKDPRNRYHWLYKLYLE